jgi:flavin reductase (DIM6/NTAB) family NADH-FMN oxidoreductase RutF
MKTIQPEEIRDNPFTMIGDDWLLIGAEKAGKVNAMTASWGGMGIIWNKPVVTIYLRPSRYTKELVDNGKTFSINVLPRQERPILDYCGSHSGRTEDKIAAAKLNVEHTDDTPWFTQSRLVLICRKLYVQELAPDNFVGRDVCIKNYPQKDYHTMYIAEITKVLAEA